MLDAFLAEGEMFWQMDEKGGLHFAFQEDIDWDADMDSCLQNLDEKEQKACEALLKRGASFLQALNRLFLGESAYDTLLS